jgi:mono/diheme cytochrome c family protein
MAGFSWRFWALTPLCGALALGPGCKRSGPPDSRAEGKRLFDATCAKCHGSDGRGGAPSAEGQPAPRNFRDAAFQSGRTDEQLRDVIRGGKGPMPPFGALFNDDELTLLVAYVRGFGPQK